MWTRTVVLCLVGCTWAGPALVQMTGKQLVRGKVFSPGYSLLVKSQAQCMDACNAHASSCDGIVYHELIGKCRMVNKCAAAVQIDNSSTAVYFSKRPMIKTDGYLHIPETDSCVGLLPTPTDYAEGDKACAELNARLVVVKSQRANKAASNLLRRAVLHWAWIAENNSGNNVGGITDFVPEVVDEVEGQAKGCWGINYTGQWRQFPCKNYTLPTLCEILPFPA